MRAMLAPRKYAKQEFRYSIDNRPSPLDDTLDAMVYGLGRRVVQVPHELIYMSSTGVHKVSEHNERIVMTDTQMAGRGLYYDAIRGGLVKREQKPVVMGYECRQMVVDDPHADLPRKGPHKVVKKDYNTVGCRFLRGDTLHKVYTYKIRKGAKVHLGQELVAKTDRGDTVVVVVEIHKTPQDTLPGIVYKFIESKVAPL